MSPSLLVPPGLGSPAAVAPSFAPLLLALPLPPLSLPLGGSLGRRGVGRRLRGGGGGGGGRGVAHLDLVEDVGHGQRRRQTEPRRPRADHRSFGAPLVAPPGVAELARLAHGAVVPGGALLAAAEQALCTESSFLFSLDLVEASGTRPRARRRLPGPVAPQQKEEGRFAGQTPVDGRALFAAVGASDVHGYVWHDDVIRELVVGVEAKEEVVHEEDLHGDHFALVGGGRRKKKQKKSEKKKYMDGLVFFRVCYCSLF